MATPSAQTCDVMVDEAWITVGLDEARIHHRDALKRCPICHGRVTIQGVYSWRGYATLSHRRVHDGCPLIQKHYRGETKRHPQALEQA